MVTVHFEKEYCNSYCLKIVKLCSKLELASQKFVHKRHSIQRYLIHSFVKMFIMVPNLGDFEFSILSTLEFPIFVKLSFFIFLPYLMKRWNHEKITPKIGTSNCILIIWHYLQSFLCKEKKYKSNNNTPE